MHVAHKLLTGDAPKPELIPNRSSSLNVAKGPTLAAGPSDTESHRRAFRPPANALQPWLNKFDHWA
jgi:hypothetical protein